MKKIFIDSDIFVRDLRYHRDGNSQINQNFLKSLHTKKQKAVTSIFNILEVCGIVSFNLSETELLKLYGDFTSHYNVSILFPSDSSGILQYDIARIFDKIQTKQSLGDAQIAYVVDRFAKNLSHFVSWNAKHFQNKLAIPALTPKEFLAT